MATPLHAAWTKVRGHLRSELGAAAFDSWINRLGLLGGDDDRVVLAAPSEYMRETVTSRYGDLLRACWRTVVPHVRQIEIVVRQPDAGMPAAAAPPPAAPGRPNGHPPAEPAAAEPAFAAHLNGSPESFVLDDRFRFDSFVVGKSNELAYAAARRVEESREVKFNPLFLYGGVGLGKTHLMQAIASHIREHDPSRQVIYLSAERFMFQFIRALRERDQISFKQQFRSADVLMVDDVQFLAGKDSTQDEFFHTFNALMDQNKQLVISADRSPSDLGDIEERVRTRLGWGLAADIQQTDYELRLGILMEKAKRFGPAEIPRRVLEFLAHRITSNVRELEGALNRLVAHASLLSGRPVTLEMAQEVLHDLLRANDRRLTVEEIQKKVAQHYNIRLQDMSSDRRSRHIARPRQVAMYLCKALTQKSLPDIGRKFDKDHTTVIHAVRRIGELRKTDAALDEDLDLLTRMLES